MDLFKTFDLCKRTVLPTEYIFQRSGKFFHKFFIGISKIVKKKFTDISNRKITVIISGQNTYRLVIFDGFPYGRIRLPHKDGTLPLYINFLLQIVPCLSTVHSIFHHLQLLENSCNAQETAMHFICSSNKKQGQAIDMQLYRSLFLFPAAGCHFKGPLALRHSFSTALLKY